jgi:hypothetical protein
MTISRTIGPLTYWLRVPTATSRDRQPVFGCEDAHSRVLVRDLRRLLEALRVVARVIEPQRGPRPALQRHRTLPGSYYLAAHLQSPRRQQTRRPTPLPVWLTSQVRTSGRGYPTGVALLLLSPSASPERVWLYAAELDERLLAPHILTSTRCIRVPVAFETACAFRSFVVSPEFGGPPTPRSPNPCTSVCRPPDRRPTE